MCSNYRVQDMITASQIPSLSSVNGVQYHVTRCVPNQRGERAHKSQLHYHRVQSRV